MRARVLGAAHLRTVAIVVGVTFLAMQLVPYGWARPNPAVRLDAPWPDDESRRLARIACYDCHSNETRWPAYSYVAPLSWMVRRDVERGRDELNFSEWDRDADEADDAIETLLDRSMPPRQYTLVHRDAALDDRERAVLIEALRSIGVD